MKFIPYCLYSLGHFGGKIPIFEIETIPGIFDYCSPAIIFFGIQINGLLTKWLISDLTTSLCPFSQV